MTPDPTTPPTRRPPAWAPCRRHVFETLDAIPLQHRDRAVWRIAAQLWDRIRRSPDFAADWTDGTPAGPSCRTLLGQPVELVPHSPSADDAFAISLTLPVDCRPYRG